MQITLEINETRKQCFSGTFKYYFNVIYYKSDQLSLNLHNNQVTYFVYKSSCVLQHLLQKAIICQKVEGNMWNIFMARR